MPSRYPPAALTGAYREIWAQQDGREVFRGTFTDPKDEVGAIGDLRVRALRENTLIEVWTLFHDHPEDTDRPCVCADYEEDKRPAFTLGIRRL